MSYKLLSVYSSFLYLASERLFKVDPLRRYDDIIEKLNWMKIIH